jgi:hypothetical protein
VVVDLYRPSGKSRVSNPPPSSEPGSFAEVSISPRGKMEIHCARIHDGGETGGIGDEPRGTRKNNEERNFQDGHELRICFLFAEPAAASVRGSAVEGPS